MSQEMRKVVLETVIPSKFKYVARDLDGSIHVFENEPNLDYGTNKSPAVSYTHLTLPTKRIV